MTTTTATEADARRTSYREVLASQRFRVLFTTRTLGIVGESLRITTLSVLIFSTTHSPVLSALAFGIGFLPQMPGTMLLGSLADRVRPRRLIAAGYTLQCAAAAALALLHMPTAAALGLLAIVAFFTPVFMGATSRLVAESLTGDAYVLGRSLFNISSSGAQVVGLALGGATVALLGVRWALLLSAAMQAGCALTVRFRLADLDPPGGDGEAVLRASWTGAAKLLHHATVRRLMLAQWLPSTFVAGAESLVVAYAGQRHFANGTYGILLACLPIGMLLGDLIVGRLLRPAVREALVAPLVAVMGLPLVVFVIDPSPFVCVLILLVSGSGFAYGLGLQRAFLDALPEDSRGQAFGLLSSGIMTLQGLSPLVFGAAAALATTGAAMATAGVATLLTACWTASWQAFSGRSGKII